MSGYVIEANLPKNQPKITGSLAGTLVFGVNGATFVPFVSQDGVISWQNDRGLPNPMPVDIQGPAGPKGDTGATGPEGPEGPRGEPFTYADFTAEQLENLRGPQGIQGERGLQGIQGIPGVQGDRGPEGPAGPQGEPFTYEDFTQAQLENLRGPQGVPGAQGIQGPAGPQGPAGDDGKTPVRGTDYWTAADIAEIKSYVDESILGGAW